MIKYLLVFMVMYPNGNYSQVHQPTATLNECIDSGVMLKRLNGGGSWVCVNADESKWEFKVQ